MKKTLAMLLAVMMLLSTTAFAASDTIINATQPAWDDDGNETNNADIDVFDSVHYSDALTDQWDEHGEMATELWLQVDATGQIDVTVPLVLVFQTNIDGGNATSPSEYKFTNWSSADLVVTKIEVAHVGTAVNTQPMTIDAWDANANIKRDHYMAQMTVGANVDLGTNETGIYDLATTLHDNDRYEGGLFELTKGDTDASTGADTAVEVAMRTGRLSFVTSREEEDDEDTLMEDVMDTDKGIHLLTITYTVAIDSSDDFGEIIKGADGTALTTADNANPVEVTANGSGTVPTGSNVAITEQGTNATEGNTND